MGCPMALVPIGSVITEAHVQSESPSAWVPEWLWGGLTPCRPEKSKQNKLETNVLT